MATENNLLIWSSVDADNVLAAFAVMKYCADNDFALELKDLNGITTGDVDTYIRTLVADTYDKLFITAPCEVSASSTPDGKINLAQQYALRSVIKVEYQGTESDLIEDATTFTAATIGDSAITDWTTNLHAGSHVIITGGTGTDQLSEIKSNTTTVATIWGTFYAVPDATSDFKIVTGMQMYLLGNNHSVGTVYKTSSQLAWETLFDVGLPPVYYALSGEFYKSYGTASAVGATSITDSTKSWSTNQFVGKVVQISYADTNGFQYATITSNNGTVLTLSDRWSDKLTPTGTPAYKIVENESKVFWDMYVSYYAMVHWRSGVTNLDELTRLTDINGVNHERPVGASPVTDWNYFVGTVISQGKVIFGALKINVWWDGLIYPFYPL